MHEKTHRVVIIGGGFGGLWATRGLATAPVRITLVDRSNHHLFQPLLYQVATAGLSSPDIAAPLRHILCDQRNVEVRLGKVVAIDVIRKSIVSEDGSELSYDTLVLATGATHAYFGNDAWAAHAPGLKTLADALQIRQRILSAFERAELATSMEEREEWMHFAIVGGGPTGVELAGTSGNCPPYLTQGVSQYRPSPCDRSSDRGGSARAGQFSRVPFCKC